MSVLVTSSLVSASSSQPQPGSTDLRSYLSRFGHNIDAGFAALLEQFVLQLPVRKEPVTKSDYEKIRTVLFAMDLSVDITDKVGQLRIVLTLLVNTEDVQRVKDFLEGLDPNSKKDLFAHKDFVIGTVLHEHLSFSKKEDIIAYLLESGAVLCGDNIFFTFDLLRDWLSSPLFPILYKRFRSEASPEQMNFFFTNTFGNNEQTFFHLAVIHRLETATLVQMIHDGAMLLEDSHGKTPLHYAASDENMLEALNHMIRHLVVKGRPLGLNNEDKSKETVLSYLINGNQQAKDLVDFVIRLGGKLDPRTYKPKKGFTPFHYAIFLKSPLEVFEELLKKGGDINAQDEEGFTPLHYAANRHASDQIVQWLLSKGASTGIQSKEGYTCFHSAVFSGNDRVLPLLFGGEFDPRIIQAEDRQGKSALSHMLSSRRCLSAIPYFLKWGADLEQIRTAEISPLLLALYTSASREQVEEILSHIDPSTLNEPDSVHGYTPLHIAVLCKADPAILSLLIAKGALQNRDKQGLIPLAHVDCTHPGAREVYQALLGGLTAVEREEVLHLIYPNGEVLARLIEKKGDPKLIALLLQWGARIDIPTRSGGYPLHYAGRHPSALEVSSLLLLKADKALRKQMLLAESFGSSPLGRALDANNLELCCLLLQGLDAQDCYEVVNFSSEGIPPLLFAIMKKMEPAFLRFLTERGAKISVKLNAPDNVINGDNALHLAANRYPRSLEAWLALLEPHSAEEREQALNTQNAEGYTALHLATHIHFDIEIIKLLLSNGANPNVQCLKGETPMHRVSKRHVYRLIDLFLKAGADPTIRNRKGIPALENPQRMLQEGERSARLWQQFSYVRDAMGRIIACRFENPAVKEGTFCMIQAQRDDSASFSMFADELDQNLERIIKKAQGYRSTYFKVVSTVASAAEAIMSIPGYIDELDAEGHGPGEDFALPALIEFDKGAELTVDNPLWKAALKAKLTKKSKMVVLSCGGGRTEKNGAINLCQEAALTVLGMPVIASEKSFSPKNMIYGLPELIDLRFYDKEDAEDLTIVYVNDFKYKPCQVTFV